LFCITASFDEQGLLHYAAQAIEWSRRATNKTAATMMTFSCLNSQFGCDMSRHFFGEYETDKHK